MQVYKFGGASIATPERMKALIAILQKAEKPLVVIVSALGKTTNALESIVQAAQKGEHESAKHLLFALQELHQEFVLALMEKPLATALLKNLNQYFVSIQAYLDEVEKYKEDAFYDQIVCIGELLSTTIFAHYLQSVNVENTWVDARTLIHTNDYFRNAVVDETQSQQAVQEILSPLLTQNKLVITQGFIGKTPEGLSTTLGREGSDYSAALIAAMMDAAQVTIWKDVPGFLNADPRKFPDAIRIPEISYYEVIELAYYGAQIIHPKTIKPLQNKGIPLFVKCFLDDTLEGTVIRKKLGSGSHYPLLIVHKGDQLLMKITTKDYSFITEENLSKLYEIFALHRVKINMIQNAAISFVACIDAKHFAKEQLIQALSLDYDVKINDACTLLTVRHYEDPASVESLVQQKKVLLRQRSRRVFQVLYKDY